MSIATFGQVNIELELSLRASILESKKNWVRRCTCWAAHLSLTTIDAHMTCVSVDSTSASLVESELILGSSTSIVMDQIKKVQPDPRCSLCLRSRVFAARIHTSEDLGLMGMLLTFPAHGSFAGGGRQFGIES